MVGDNDAELEFEKHLQEAELLSSSGGEEAAAPAQVVEDPPAAPVDEPFPGFSQLPEDARNAWNTLKTEREEAAARAVDFERRWKAQHGQLAPTQRELENLRRKMQEFEKSGTDSDKTKLKDAIARHNEMYPDDAGALNAVAETVDRNSSALEKRLNELQSKVDHYDSLAYKSQQTDILAQSHPDWREIPAEPTWQAWLESIDPEMRELADSRHAKDVAKLMNEYKRDKRLAELLFQQEQAAQGNPVQPAAPAARNKPEVDPKPTVRKPITGKAANGNSLDGEDKFLAELQQAGYSV